MRIAFASLAVLVGCASSPPRSAWSVFTSQDVEALHQTLLDDHPGPVDTENPAFRAWLERGYTEAMSSAQAVSGYGGYAAVVRRYVAGFRDGHLGVTFRITATARRWPGFLVRRAGTDYVVAITAGKVPLGTVVESCDGRPLDEIMRTDVFPYYGDPDLEASWSTSAPYLFIDASNPLRQLPTNCVLRGAGTLDLPWTEIDWNDLNARIKVAFSPGEPGVRKLADGTVWVTLPTFSSDALTAAKLKPIVEDAQAWRSARRIVFDVRGNGGGSSVWGWQLAKNLWGTAYMEAAATNAMVGKPAIGVDWRASADNLAQMRKEATEVGASMGEEARKWATDVANGITAARAAGKPYFSESDDQPAATKVALPAPATQARVFFLTDSACGSACLDFADVLHAVPGVTQVGQPTSADTQYMEVRAAPLPSSMAELHHAMKVYRHRPRGKEPYLPAVRFPGDIKDTAAVEAWIATLP